MIQYRDEQETDRDAIRDLHYQAFNGHPQHAPGAAPTEHRIIDGLRGAGALAISLVAQEGDIAIGHAALSPVRIDGAPADWLGLGPIGVLPQHQGRGVGSELMRRSIERANAMDMGGIILVGDPAFYARFGFTSGTPLFIPGVPEANVLALHLNGDMPQGTVAFHSAFFEAA